MKKVLLSWSSGKDSAWTLHVLSQQEGIQIVGLLTTLNEVANRISMHAVRRRLLEKQAQALGLPLWCVPLPSPCSNSEYEDIMRELCQQVLAFGIGAVAFGDLYLPGIRQYRERLLQGTGLEPLFPIWGMPTRELAAEMIASGLRAKITCVDPRAMPSKFAGREFNQSFLAELPVGVDPCGENGEFHSFVYDGPMFPRRLSLTVGEIVVRDGFVFADLLPADAEESETE